MSRSTRKPSTSQPPAPAITNLETIGDQLKIYSLRNLLQNKRDFRTTPPARLGNVLQPWFEKHVQKPAHQLGPITEIWVASLPAKILDRSRLVAFHRGTLTVSLDSAPVRAELDALLRQGLLQRLQTLSRGAIYRVKTAVNLHENSPI